MWSVNCINTAARDALLHTARHYDWDVPSLWPDDSLCLEVDDSHVGMGMGQNEIPLSEAFERLSKPPSKAKYPHETGIYLGDYFDFSMYLDGKDIIGQHGYGARDYDILPLVCVFKGFSFETMSTFQHAAALAILFNIDNLITE